MVGPLLLKVGAGGLAMAAGAGLTFVLVDPSDATAPPVAQAWVDHPFDGSSLPEVGEVGIIVHATDPDGVAVVTISIDGVEVHTEDLAGAEELVTVETTWEPDGPGTYELQVVGEDGDGGAGQPGVATFTVGEPPPEDSTTTTTETDRTTTTVEGETTTTATTQPGDPSTASTTPTTRPTSTTSPATTVAPCRPSTPRLANPPDGQVVTTRTPRLTWTYSGCGPDRFTVQVSDNDLFLPARDGYLSSLDVPGSATNVTWEPLPCFTTYYWRVRAVAPGGTSAWSSARSLFLDCV